jgi:hypothetical protein
MPPGRSDISQICRGTIINNCNSQTANRLIAAEQLSIPVRSRLERNILHISSLRHSLLPKPCPLGVHLVDVALLDLALITRPEGLNRQNSLPADRHSDSLPTRASKPRRNLGAFLSEDKLRRTRVEHWPYGRSPCSPSYTSSCSEVFSGSKTHSGGRHRTGDRGG